MITPDYIAKERKAQDEFWDSLAGPVEVRKASLEEISRRVKKKSSSPFPPRPLTTDDDGGMVEV